MTALQDSLSSTACWAAAALPNPIVSLQVPAKSEVLCSRVSFLHSKQLRTRRFVDKSSPWPLRFGGHRTPPHQQCLVVRHRELRRSSTIRFTLSMASDTDIFGPLPGFSDRHASTSPCHAEEGSVCGPAARRCQSKSKAACCCSVFRLSINDSIFITKLLPPTLARGGPDADAPSRPNIRTSVVLACVTPLSSV